LRRRRRRIVSACLRAVVAQEECVVKQLALILGEGLVCQLHHARVERLLRFIIIMMRGWMLVVVIVLVLGGLLRVQTVHQQPESALLRKELASHWQTLYQSIVSAETSRGGGEEKKGDAYAASRWRGVGSQEATRSTPTTLRTGVEKEAGGLHKRTNSRGRKSTTTR